jgi:hypothetical protein
LRSNRGSTIGLVAEGLPRLLPRRGETIGQAVEIVAIVQVFWSGVSCGPNVASLALELVSLRGRHPGRPYIGTRPSRKSVKSLLGRIHQRTTRQWYADDPKSTVARISSMLRGWCGYFDQGPVITIYDLIHRYTERRIRRWLLRRSGRKGTGFGQIPDEYLYETLGLYTVPRKRSDLPRAKI